MGTLSGEKRKNDAPRRFQWWLLVIGFVLGVLFAQFAFPSYMQTVTVFSDGGSLDEGLYLTATAVVVGATATSESLGDSNPAAPVDPLAATATAIVVQATQQATPVP